MSMLSPTASPAAAAIREVTSPGVFESLGRIDRTGAIAPGLAQSWSISEDGKEYVFKLRKGVTFHNGEPFDASMVKFSLDRLFAAEPAVAGGRVSVKIRLYVRPVDRRSCYRHPASSRRGRRVHGGTHLPVSDSCRSGGATAGVG